MSEPFSWPMIMTERPRKRAEAADDGVVLAEVAVTGERREILDQRRDVVEAMRALGMAGDLRFLPRRQLGVGFGEGCMRLLLELLDFVGDVDRCLGAFEGAQLLHLALEFCDRCLEFQIGAHDCRGRTLGHRFHFSSLVASGPGCARRTKMTRE